MIVSQYIRSSLLFYKLSQCLLYIYIRYEHAGWFDHKHHIIIYYRHIYIYNNNAEK